MQSPSPVDRSPASSLATIRNFCIIAHIDHGKTTLTDCLLKSTASIPDREFEERMMDSNPIEKERGITIKLAPVRMQYSPLGSAKIYQLNLIDTPGHVDFGYEVSRSLAACEGALLVVDATQGVQAQTLSTFHKAVDLGLTVIPVLNKVDLPSADADSTALQLMELCHCSEQDIIKVSAKQGLNIDALLDSIVIKIPPPVGNRQAGLRALLVTSLFDNHRGAIALVRIIDGEVTARDKLTFYTAHEVFTPVEIGCFTPGLTPVETLRAGEVGYVATGLKDVRSLKVGDTLTTPLDLPSIEPLQGYREPNPSVFMELYPTDASEYPTLLDAMSKLILRDAALTYAPIHSPALGSGLRVGFLGILHAEIVLERLELEFDQSLVATTPSVTYQLELVSGEITSVYSAAQWPDPTVIRQAREPWVRIDLYTPAEYLGGLLQLLQGRRAEVLQTINAPAQLQLVCHMPLAELITDFQDTLKSITSGYGSFDYEFLEYRAVDAVKVSLLLNRELIEALSFVAVASQAEARGRNLVSKLKEKLPRQMFEIPIQATIGGKIIARETITPYRKDVTAKLYGGDATRRKKLLAKQAKGKKRMKQFGKVEIDQATFLEIMRSH